MADGQGTSASFNNPWGIDINQADGCLYVADYYNHKIRKITPQGNLESFGMCGHF